MLALRRRLAEKGLSEQERKKLEAEIARLEDRIGIS